MRVDRTGVRGRPVRDAVAPLVAVACLLAAVVGCGDPPCTTPPAGDPDPTDDGSPACASGEILDDAGACVPARCGTARWPSIAPDAGAVVYVDVDAAPAGTGSAEAPLASIGEALAAVAGAAEGAVIAVTDGTYRENLVLEGDVAGIHLAGRCPERVVLDASAGDAAGVRTMRSVVGDAWTISGLAVEDSRDYGIWVQSGDLGLEDVIVAGNAGGGVWNDGVMSSLQLIRVEIRDTRVVQNSSAVGVQLAGGWLWMEDSSISSNRGAGIWAGGAQIELERVAIRDTVAQNEFYPGAGVWLERESSLRAHDCVFDGNVSAGLMVTEGSSAVLDDVEIRNTWGGTQTFGLGALWVEEASRVEVRNTSLRDNAGAGVAVTDAGSEVYLDHVAVLGTFPGGELDPDVDGIGVRVTDGAALHALDSTIEHNATAGVEVTSSLEDQPSSVSLVGVSIHGTVPGALGGSGHGVRVGAGGSLQMQACALDGNAASAVVATGSATATLEGISATGNGVDGDAPVGGITARDGAHVDAFGCAVADGAGPGLLVDGGSLHCASCDLGGNRFANAVAIGGELVLEDGRVEAARPHGSCGGGLGVFGGAQGRLSLDHVAVAGQPRAAVWLDQVEAASLTYCWLHGDAGNPFAPELHGVGDALFVTGGVLPWSDDDDSGLLLAGNNILGAAGAGVFLDASSADFRTNWFSDNAVDVLQQGCGGDVEPAEIPYESWVVELCEASYDVDRVTFDPDGCD